MVKILIYFFDVAGAWTGIDFRFIENINSSLDNCVIEYEGSDDNDQLFRFVETEVGCYQL